jgi:FixJ family two-component response regulator
MVNLNQLVAVVDDDESICRTIKRLLRSVGIKADTFSSGEEFLDKLSSPASYRPGCVVMDFQIQRIDGLELQRRLAPTRMPVIFITAHDDPAVREKGLASGAVGFLRKPFDAAELIEAVKMASGETSILLKSFFS